MPSYVLALKWGLFEKAPRFEAVTDKVWEAAETKQEEYICLLDQGHPFLLWLPTILFHLVEELLRPGGSGGQRGKGALEKSTVSFHTHAHTCYPK